MALQEYEVVDKKIDKSKSWINVKNKQLISREIKVPGYYCIVKKYNFEFNDYDYLIIIGNNEFANNRDYRRIWYDSYGRAKISIASIANVIIGNNTKDFQISLSLVEDEDNYKVYRIDI